MEYDYIAKNIGEIRKRIDNSAANAGRSPSDVKLVAVSKTVELPAIRAAVNEGITELGENRVQELMTKIGEVPANWHLIGHLQTNKVKSVVGRVSLIHSVDSLRLAAEINKRADEMGLVQHILVEVNISGEQSKFGVSPDKALELIRNLWEMKSLRVKGLMTVAPYVDEAVKNRDLFKKMRNLFVDINDKRYDNEGMTDLSMGMSGDFEEAVAEGATIVRIGTGIFGRRFT